MSEELEKNTEKDARGKRKVAKRKATSVVWKYIGYRKDDVDQKQVLCRQCLAIVATTRGNTTNLFDHLNQHHKALYDECKPDLNAISSKKTISDAFVSVAPYEKRQRNH